MELQQWVSGSFQETDTDYKIEGIFTAIGRISAEEAFFYDITSFPDIMLLKNGN